MLRFQFNERKAIEALTLIAWEWPNVTAFYASKIFFFAEKLHLNRYARPIVGDTFTAMTNGPVPSTIYDFIKGRFDQAEDPDAIVAAIDIQHDKYRSLKAKRQPNFDVLSKSDVECLNEAISFCKAHKGSLSDLTHHERSWAEAPSNGSMDYEHMFDDSDGRESKVVEAKEFALYGVL